MKINVKNKQDEMYQRIQKHGQDLRRIFGVDIEPIPLCKKLRRLEVAANRIACAYCNGEIEQEKYEIESDKILARVFAVIGEKWRGVVFFNGDPRGYTLKIKDDYARDNGLKIHRDFGGYGILAPDLSI